MNLFLLLWVWEIYTGKEDKVAHTYTRFTSAKVTLYESIVFHFLQRDVIPKLLLLQ